jgi:rubrerythrin
MANLFLASEILEMNVTEERNGAAFYLALSESAKSNKLRLAAATIAEQEKMHEQRFARLLQETEQRNPDESFPGEYDAYLQSLIRYKMFSDEEDARAAAVSQSDTEAVKFALTTEQATLGLLNELIRHVDSNEKKVVNLTIEEENQHVAQLKSLLREI